MIKPSQSIRVPHCILAILIPKQTPSKNANKVQRSIYLSCNIKIRLAGDSFFSFFMSAAPFYLSKSFKVFREFLVETFSNYF